MRSVRSVVIAALAATAAVGAVAVEGEGLVASDRAAWPRWQGRLSLGSVSPLFHPDAMNTDSNGLKVSAASLLGKTRRGLREPHLARSFSRKRQSRAACLASVTWVPAGPRTSGCPANWSRYMR